MSSIRGVNYFLRTGKVHPSVKGYRKLRKYLKDIENDLVAEHGGWERVGIKEELLIKSCASCYAVIVLATMYAENVGIFRPKALEDGDLELHRVLDRSLIAYSNTLRLNLLALDKLKSSGMKRDELSEYISEKYKKPSRTSLKTPLIAVECKKS